MLAGFGNLRTAKKPPSGMNRIQASGNKAADGNADTLSAGVYIVIEDENGTVLPDVPKTGDTSRLAAYIILMCCSASSLLVLFFAGGKEKMTVKIFRRAFAGT